jgi:2-methylcitrate dehydratase PrpD
MKRRDFLRHSAATGAVFAVSARPAMFAVDQPPCALASFPHIDNLTHYVADFIVNLKYDEIPSEVIELGKKSILDGLGLALCGSVADTGGLLEAYTRPFSSSSAGAAVIGTARKLPARFAAFTNGVAIHVDDYDDTQLAAEKDRVYGLLVHPTVCVLPAVLADSESRGKSGKDLMLAYHIGVEVECKIAEAISPRSYEDGFHTTGTCGTFGSAAACAKLRAFDIQKTIRALGIAGSQGCGLRENFGSMMKPFQAGHSAETGVTAADFSELGWSATEKVLEAERGFFHAYGGGYDPGAILNKLGKPWTFASPGISIKPFPSGSLTHPGMTEMLRLIRKYQIKPDQVTSVDVGTNRNMPNTLIRHNPVTGLEAKFSMEFCIAILLLEGKAGLNQFTDAVVNRPDVQDMIARIHFGVNAEAEKAGYDKMTTILNIHLKDGRTLSGRADFGKGSPADPMSYAEAADKFRDCAEFAKWPREKAEAVVTTVRNLESATEVRTLIGLCSR